MNKDSGAAAVHCEGCGAATDPGTRFCPQCGQGLPAAPPPPATTAYCPQCGTLAQASGAYCRECGAMLGAGATVSLHAGQGYGAVGTRGSSSTEVHHGRAAPQSAMPRTPTADEGAVTAVSSYLLQVRASVPWGSLRGDGVRRVFSQAFVRHSAEQSEQRFLALAGTDDLAAADGLPRPWLFTRVLLLFGGSFLVLFATLLSTGYDTLLPGVILLGSFAVPLALAFLALESNTPRGLTLYRFIRLFVAGAILAILFTSLLNEIWPSWNRAFGASGAALVEEPAKLAAAIVLARGISTRWSLNGLAVGAAVGAGFAAIESAGYALIVLLDYGGDDMAQTLLQRSLQSVGTHAVWTAVAAAALWTAARGGPIRARTFTAPAFVGPFALVVALHFLWNSDWAAFTGAPVYGALIVVAAAVGLAFLLQGSRDYADNRSLEHEAEPRPSSVSES